MCAQDRTTPGRPHVSLADMMNLLAEDAPAAETPDASTIPDDAIACWCNNVTAGEIRSLLRDGTAHNLADVQRLTRASGGCGTCLPKIRAIVDLTLGETH